MVSQAVTNAMGIIGGVVLAVCQAPQVCALGLAACRMALAPIPRSHAMARAVEVLCTGTLPMLTPACLPSWRS